MPYRSKKSKKKYRLKPVPITIAILLILLLVFLLYLALNGNKKEPLPPSSSPSSDVAPSSLPASSDTDAMSNANMPQGKRSDWNLILLNRDAENKVDDDLDIEKVKFNSQYIDKRASEYYEAMVAAAKEDGINLFLRSGFREHKTQQLYYDSNIKNYMDQGKSKEEAVRLTEEYYAIPGHSEHQSGLACDIISQEYQDEVYTLSEQFAKTDAFKWLDENCTSFGFVLRYEKDKVDITKINYEPWHYRYVGAEHAKYMKENGLCLEEYLELLPE